METKNEFKNVLPVIEEKLNGIELNMKTVIDLCRYYMDALAVNYEEEFLNIMNLAERTQKDESDIRDVIESII